LEARLAPTADLVAVADGYVQGAYYTSGQGPQLNTTENQVRVSSSDYQRGLVLFDLAGLDPTARITSATLSVNVNLLQYGSTGGTPAVTFYGFRGDGLLGPNDFRAADSTPVGSLGTTNTGLFNVPISAAFLQSFVGQSRYAEFSVKMTSGEDLWFNSREATYAPAPTLHLTYTHAPVAAADAYATPQDAPLTVAGPGVLANDTDADGDPITASLLTGPSHGTLALNADGSFTYTPNAGYNGPDGFTYKANDGQYDSNVAAVSLAVGTFTPAPTAANDAYTVTRGTPLTVTAPGVLGNDTSPSGASLSATLVTGPAHGTLALNADGSFTYTPNAGYNGPDSFTYQAGDGTSVSNTATVALNALGSIGGRIWDDLNADGKEGASEPGLAVRTVFLDQNQNGVLDPGEATAVTAADGTYSFNGLAPGAYLVAMAPFSGWQQTAPTNVPEQKVDVGVPGITPFTFDELASTGDQAVGPYHRAGYTIDTTTPGKFLVHGSSSSYYPGSPALVPSVAPTTVTLRRDDGTPFGVAHVDLAEATFYPQGYPPPTVTFVGNRPDGSTLTQSFRHDAFFNMEPYDFSGFTGLSSVTWAFTNLSNEAQFDNLWLESTAPYDASGLDFGSVRSANSAPVAVNDSYKTPASTVLPVAAPGVLGNDSDPDGDPITPTLSAGPSHGTLAFHADGSFTYTPTSGYNGPDSFTYTLSDGRLTSNVATVNIDVGVFNHPPSAADDAYTVTKSTPLTVAAPGVLGNDTDPDTGETLTARLGTYPSHGSLTFNADGSFTYTPFGAYLGPDSFTYQAFDGALYSNTATVRLTVSGPDDPPVAANDSYLVTKNTEFTASAPGVLANDSDPNGQPITAALVAGPAHGTLTLSANGSFVYHPATGYYGPDSFTYTASDGQLSSNVATVSLYVDGPPVATAESFTTNENQTLSIPPPGVLANDSDPDAGDTLTAQLIYSPSHGQLTLNADGSLTYVPNRYYYGTDSFSYRAWDGHFASNTVTDTITVNHVNQPPVAADDAYVAPSNGTLTAAVSQTFLNMQSDPGDYIGQGRTYSFGAGSGTFTLSGGPGGVIVSFSNATDWWYLDISPPTGGRLAPGTYANAARFPSATQPGLDVFGDGRGSNTVTGQFTVTQALYDAQNQIIAFSASFEQHSEGSTPALRGQVAYKSSFDKAEGLLFNDSDPDNDPLTVSLSSGPSHGALALNPDGSFTYTPNAGYAGPDSFTYTDSDGQLTSNVATARITVAGPPTVANGSGITDVGVPLTVPAPGVLAGASDPNGLPLTAALVAGPAHGVAVVNADGSFTYTPAAGYHGPDSFTFKANNGQYDSAPGTYSLYVNAPPVAANLAYTLNEDQALAADAAHGLLTGGSDPDGNPLTAAVVAGPAHGALQAKPDGSFTYTPTQYYSGPDSFTYKVNDGRLDSNTATVALTVNFVNQEPSFTAGPNQSVLEDAGPQTVTAWATNVSAGPPSEAGQALNFIVTTSNPGLFSAAPAISPAGTLTYTSAPNANGTATVTVVLHDDGGTANGGVDTSPPQTFTITVAPVNDPPTADNHSVTTLEDTAATVTLSGSDLETPASALVFTVTSLPTLGTLWDGATPVALNAQFTGSPKALTYRPNANANGADGFTYTVTDRGDPDNSPSTPGYSAPLTSPPATISLTVTPVNDPPTLDPITNRSTSENAPPITVSLTGISPGPANETGQTLTVTATSSNTAVVPNPTVSYTSPSATGTLTIAPLANRYGTATITVTVKDNGGTANGGVDTFTRTFVVTVAKVDQPPTANPDTYQVPKNTTLTVAAPGVLANDTDPENDPLTAVLMTGPTHGTLTFHADGSFSYVPKKNFTGTDQFTYQASDGTLRSKTATVTLTVGGKAAAGFAAPPPPSVTLTGRAQTDLAGPSSHPSATALRRPAAGPSVANAGVGRVTSQGSSWIALPPGPYGFPTGGVLSKAWRRPAR
jgi:VCBS repeat-containing protein